MCVSKFLVKEVFYIVKYDDILDEVHMIHISCGEQCVWGVDRTGDIYMRLGNCAPSQFGLNQVWIPVDGCTCIPGAKFTLVMTSPDDRMVCKIFLAPKCCFKTPFSWNTPKLSIQFEDALIHPKAIDIPSNLLKHLKLLINAKHINLCY